MTPLIIAAGDDVRERVALWLLERVEYVTEIPGGYEAIGVARDGELVGACLFTEYRPCAGGGSIVMWAAGHNWLSRRIVRAMLAYPFRQLNCHRITALVARSNKKSRKLLTAVGFREEGKLRRGLSVTADLLVYGLLKSECRWL